MSFAKSLRCIECGREYSLELLVYVCEKCGDRGFGHGTLDAVYDYDEVATKIDKGVLERRRPSVWKYRELLPVLDESKVVSLGEGGTPLHKCKRLAHELGIKNLYAKNETVNPTWSFKDRALTVSVSKALELKVEAVVLTSSGNAAVSASAYCARAGIPCFIFVPAGMSLGKITQIIMQGARVFAVRGSVIEAGMLAFSACSKYGWFHLTTAKSINPYQTEGLRTEAYELCEQLGWKSPDWVVVPVGSGDNLGGIWKGFKEFHDLGFVKSLPHMAGVQAEGAAPVVKAFNENKEFFEVEPIFFSANEAKTIAEGIRVNVVTGPWVLNALRESKGAVSAVSDKEILEAEKLLASKEGIFAEPSSAAAIAGLKRLVEQGDVDSKDTVVCVITGAGIKDVKSAEKVCKKPPRIGADLEELDRLLAM